MSSGSLMDLSSQLLCLREFRDVSGEILLPPLARHLLVQIARSWRVAEAHFIKVEARNQSICDSLCITTYRVRRH